MFLEMGLPMDRIHQLRNRTADFIVDRLYVPVAQPRSSTGFGHHKFLTVITYARRVFFRGRGYIQALGLLTVWK